MRRTLGTDVLECPRCGGRLQLMALIEDARVVARILPHLGLPTGLPDLKAAVYDIQINQATTRTVIFTYGRSAYAR